MMVYGRNYYSMTGVMQGPPDFVIPQVLPAGLVIAYWSSHETTTGKMAIGVMIVDVSTGDAPSLGQYIGWYAGYFLSIVAIGLGLLWVGFDRKKQGWKDMLFGTVVV